MRNESPQDVRPQFRLRDHLPLRYLAGPENRMLRLFMLDAVLINVAYFLTTGFIMSGYLIELGTSDTLVALLGNSANFSSLLAVFSYALFERFASRKRLLLNMHFISRSLIAAILLPPLLFNQGSPALYTMVAVLILLSDAIWGIYRVGWIIWMMQLVPAKMQTRYIYARQFLIRLFGLLFLQAAGILLDQLGKSYLAFAIVFLTSYLFSILDLFTLAPITEPAYPKVAKTDRSGFWKPVTDRTFRSLLVFSWLFAFTQSMALSSSQLYLIRYLRFDYALISSVNVLASVTMLLSNQLWAKAERRFGFRPILMIAVIFCAGELFAMAAAGAAYPGFLVLAAICSGIGMVGQNTSVFSYRYQIMGACGRTAAEGWFYFATGSGMLLGPLTGRTLVSLAGQSLNHAQPIDVLRLLFLAAALAMLALLLYIRFRLKPAQSL